MTGPTSRVLAATASGQSVSQGKAGHTFPTTLYLWQQILKRDSYIEKKKREKKIRENEKKERKKKRERKIKEKE